MRKKIIIDPLYNPLYASYYIKGLTDKFGKKNISFSANPFLQLKNRMDIFNFIIGDTKYSIDTSDANYIINTAAYDWCDIYGKVNANWQKTPKDTYPKIVSLVPSFGIRLWNFPCFVIHLLQLLLTNKIEGTFRKYIGKHKRSQQKLFLKQYDKKLSIKEKYIFHLSTLWYSDKWNKNDDGVNRVRANFIRVCLGLSAFEFEGGLLPQIGRSSEELFRDVLYNSKKQMPMKEYIEKTKRSMFVFNTPSFWNCHGWKLGEYLALGKAIISTPLSNNLPFPLQHGINIHFVQDDSEQELKSAINQIIKNPDYRQKLEDGARKYWETYGTPEKSLELLGIK